MSETRPQNRQPQNQKQKSVQLGHRNGLPNRLALKKEITENKSRDKKNPVGLQLYKSKIKKDGIRIPTMVKWKNNHPPKVG